MARDIKMIGLDLDDTTLDAQKKIRPAVRAAIEAAISAGIEVLPATGRQLAGIPKAFLEIPGVKYALTANGANIVDLRTGETVYSDCFDRETALSLVRQILEFKTVPSVFLDGRGYAEGKSLDFLVGRMDESMIEYLRASREPVDSLLELVETTEHKVEKYALLFPEEDDRQAAFMAFSARGDTTVTSSIRSNLELNTATANKGAGLLALAQRLGIQREQVMAIGDSSNDLEMLRVVGYGVAMGNATDEVKAAADAVTRTFEEDGVAAAIEGVL